MLGGHCHSISCRGCGWTFECDGCAGYRLTGICDVCRETNFSNESAPSLNNGKEAHNGVEGDQSRSH